MPQLKDLYSKVKDIYIELPNYSFFHSPTSMDKKDAKFIGRETLIQRLKNILNNSQTKSGAFLITGYRGVGKTSLVNKVLSDLAEIPSLLKLLKYEIRAILNLVVFYALFDEFDWFTDKPFSYSTHLSKGILLLSLILILFPIYKRFQISKPGYVYWVRILRGRQLTHKSLYQIIGVSFVTSLCIWCYVVFVHATPYSLIYTISLVLIFHAYLYCLESVYTASLESKDEKNYHKAIFSNIGKRIKNWWSVIKESVKSWMNYSNRVVVKLNLGHEELKESDILRLVAKQVERKYKRLTGFFWRFPFNHKILKLICLILAVNTFLYLWSPTERQAFMYQTGLDYVVPSQALVLHSDTLSYQAFLNKSRWKGRTSTSMVERALQGVASVDYLLYRSYQKTTGTFRGVIANWPQWSKKFFPVEIPVYVDYFGILIFLLLWQLASQLSKRRIFGIVTHTQVLARLNQLSLRISAQVSHEAGQKVGDKINLLSFFSSRKIVYPIADVREIESELISIFEDMDRIPGVFGKPSFIFVLDELDKIQANQNRAIADKESEQSNLDYGETEFIPATEFTRQRQQVVSMLLANLKHFFTTVRAKFIFIAGREMYDAALADISDRNYFLGSIFHEVIYVNSFLTEKSEDVDRKHEQKEGHMSYYHTSVEQFVCQSIIPKHFLPDNSRSLKTVHKYYLSKTNLPPFTYIDKIKDVIDLVEKKILPYSSEKVSDQALEEKKKKEFEKQLRLFKQKLLRDDELKVIANFTIMSTSITHYKKVVALVDTEQGVKSPDRKSVEEEIESFQKTFKKVDEKVRLVAQLILKLKSFINYLTYRSSGTPKKLTNLFEQYVIRVGTNQKATRSKIDDFLSIGAEIKNRKCYLRFKPDDLYIFGLIDYLTTPYFYNITRHIRNQGDKLMVSTSYLLDHLYKFHNVGFSWRNLEVTPEIIDINKAPVLRRLIHDIVDFLTYSHLEKITSGLYDFKFDSKISHEINYLSKISEKESAAFNFTLDESQEIKKHFKRKLQLIVKDNPFMQLPKDDGTIDINEVSKFLHSAALIQQSLGDLYYYDQEYDDAISAYQDAIHLFRKHSHQPLPMDFLVVLIRIMLKLGHTFEKKKSYHSALMVYGSLSYSVINSTSVDISKYLSLTKEPTLDGDGYQVVSWPTQFHPVTGSTPDEREVTYSYFADIKSLSLSSKRFELLMRSMTADNMRLMFQPSIAKLYCIEKIKSGGVVWSDVETALDEIAFLLNLVPEESRAGLEMEYYNKIGDMLFYKNTVDEVWLPKDQHGKLLSRYFHGINCTQACDYFYDVVIKRAFGAEASSGSGTQRAKISVFDKSKPELFQEFVRKNSFEFLKTTANNLADLADASIPEENGLPFPFIVNSDKELDLKQYSGNLQMLKLQCPIQLYMHAYKIHYNNNDHRRAAFQYLKILHLLVAKCKLNDLTKEEMAIIKDHIVNGVLVSLYHTYNSSTRPEIEKIKSIFKLSDALSNYMATYIFNQLPQVGEVQETLAMYNFIRVRADITAGNICATELSPAIYPKISLMYSRAVQLSIKVRGNSRMFKFLERDPFNKIEKGKDGQDRILYTIQDHLIDQLELAKDYNLPDQNDWMKEILSKNLPDALKIYLGCDEGTTKPTYSTEQAVSYLIADSIYCLTEIIRILQNFGATYIANHSFLAFAYDLRYKWCLRYEAYVYVKRNNEDATPQEKNKQPSIYADIRRLIGAESMDKLKPKFNIEKAINNYDKAIELHEGKYVYDNTIGNMHYLDDDFNDEYLHFYSALERSKLGPIKKRSKILEDILEKSEFKSKLYDVGIYMVD